MLCLEVVFKSRFSEKCRASVAQEIEQKENIVLNIFVFKTLSYPTLDADVVVLQHTRQAEI